MSLRHYEWRVWFRGHTTSKPSIHNAPILWSTKLRQPKKNSQQKKFEQMKNECLQDEVVDCSSGCMRAFVWDFEGFHRVPKVPN